MSCGTLPLPCTVMELPSVARDLSPAPFATAPSSSSGSESHSELLPDPEMLDTCATSTVAGSRPPSRSTRSVDSCARRYHNIHQTAHTEGGLLCKRHVEPPTTAGRVLPRLWHVHRSGCTSVCWDPAVWDRVSRKLVCSSRAGRTRCDAAVELGHREFLGPSLIVGT